MKLTQDISWWDHAIKKSEMISNGFEVFKAWLARFAEWILFFCLIANIIEIFPLPDPFASYFGNIVLGVQVVTLDVAGFGLASMGASAARRGDIDSAKKASRMGWTLIGIMMLTVGLVAVSVIAPTTKSDIDVIQKGLMLARVLVTVLYGHVVHSLRVSNSEYEHRVQQLEKNVSSAERELAAKQKELSNVQQHLSNQGVQLDTLRQEIGQLTGQLNLKEQELSNFQNVLDTGHDFQASRVSILEQEITREHAVQAGLRHDLFTAKTELDTVQLALESSQQMVSNLRKELSSVQKQVSTQGVQSRPKRTPAGQSNVVQLDTLIGQSDDAAEMRIRNLHKESPLDMVSARKIAELVGCSPTTASTWKERIIGEEKRVANG